MRIPFLLKPPFSGFKGRREDSFISSVEIAATCLTAAGIAVPESMMGRSLTQFYEDGPKKDGRTSTWKRETSGPSG